MNTKITKLILIALTIIRSIVCALPVEANIIGQTIPVKFAQNVTTKGLENGTGIAIEIVHDIFDADNNKVFAQGGTGYVHVENLKKSRFLGRGAKLDINRGVLIDMQGRSHNIALSANAQGDIKLSSAAGTLIGGATAFESLANISSATGAIFGVGLTLIPIAYFLRKGNEATLPKGMVLFATVIN